MNLGALYLLKKTYGKKTHYKKSHCKRLTATGSALRQTDLWGLRYNRTAPRIPLLLLPMICE